MWKRRKGRPRTEFSFDGDQLYFTFPASAVERSTRRSTTPESDSPPPAKKRRMQVETQTTGTVRSVGQRLKDAARKDVLKDTKHATAILRSPQRALILPVEPVRTLPKLTEIQHNAVRIIGQYLSDLGLRDTVDVLVQETGTRLENALASRLRDCVNRGLWNKALDIVDKMSDIANEDQCEMMRILFLEEKLKELLRINQPVMAVRLLQEDYPEWDTLRARRQYYGKLIMLHDCSEHLPPLTAEQQKKQSKELLSRIHRILPLNFMLPPSRLEKVFNQAWQHQISACSLHLSEREYGIEPDSLLRNHECDLSTFPGNCVQTLTDHNDEVWCLAFSPCGKQMASGTRNGQVAIWEVHPETLIIKMIKQMSMGGFGMVAVTTISWSADSKYLAAAGTEENHTGVAIFNIPMGNLESVVRCDRGESFSCVSFGNSQNYSVACADQKGHFYYCDIKRPYPASNSFEGYRIRSLYCMKDGKTILAADTHNRIRSYRTDTNEETTLIQEFKTIISFTVDRGENFCLVAAKAEGLRLWNLRSRQYVRSFFGAIHGEYVIVPTFGGDDQHYIATGSEDNKVVVWNIERDEPIKFLTGHKGMVNAVSWNPYYHHMLASASDDGTIKVWRPEEPEEEEND